MFAIYKSVSIDPKDMQHELALKSKKIDLL